MHKGKYNVVHYFCIQNNFVKLIVHSGSESWMEMQALLKSLSSSQAQIRPWMHVGRSWMSKEVLFFTASTTETEQNGEAVQ